MTIDESGERLPAYALEGSATMTIGKKREIVVRNVHNAGKSSLNR
jgi:hypothetical protein